MASKIIRLGDIARARSGDKGNHANIGVIAKTPAAYQWLETYLPANLLFAYFSPLKPTKVLRYEMPNLEAFNFILFDVLDGGGSLSLRTDGQGKALGQALLELPLKVPEGQAEKLMGVES